MEGGVINIGVICCPYQTLFDMIITVPVTIMVDVTTIKIIIINIIIIIIITT